MKNNGPNVNRPSLLLINEYHPCFRRSCNCGYFVELLSCARARQTFTLTLTRQNTCFKPKSFAGQFVIIVCWLLYEFWGWLRLCSSSSSRSSDKHDRIVLHCTSPTGGLPFCRPAPRPVATFAYPVLGNLSCAFFGWLSKFTSAFFCAGEYKMLFSWIYVWCVGYLDMWIGDVFTCDNFGDV